MNIRAEVIGNCIMRSYTICTVHRVIQEGVSAACSTYGKENEYRV